MHQIALFDLANWTKRVFPVFPRNIPYRARPKGPPIFLGTARLFFRKKSSPKRPPFNFFAVLRQNGCWKIPKGPPLHFFGTLRFFPKKNFSKGSPLQFFNVLRQNGCWKTPKGPPFQFFGIVRVFFLNFFSLQRVPPSISLIFYNRLGV